MGGGDITSGVDFNCPVGLIDSLPALFLTAPAGDGVTEGFAGGTLSPLTDPAGDGVTEGFVGLTLSPLFGVCSG